MQKEKKMLFPIGIAWKNFDQEDLGCATITNTRLSPQWAELVPEMPLLPGDGVEDGGDDEEAGQAKAIDPG